MRCVVVVVVVEEEEGNESQSLRSGELCGAHLYLIGVCRQASSAPCRPDAEPCGGARSHQIMPTASNRGILLDRIQYWPL